VVQSVDELHYKPEVGRSIAHRVSEVSYWRSISGHLVVLGITELTEISTTTNSWG
jgi:hypothetical protein